MYTHTHTHTHIYIYIYNNNYYESSSFQHTTLTTEHYISKFTDICVTLHYWSKKKTAKFYVQLRVY